MVEPEPPEEEAGIADANLLFRDAGAKDEPIRDAPAAQSDGPPTSGAYELEPVGETSGGERPEAEAARPVTRSSPTGQARGRIQIATEEDVEQTWSRWAEWGPSIVRVALALVVALTLIWFGFSLDAPILSMAVTALLLAIPLILSYPILITLERPVRITPEQAVRDYFGALSHHVPHYRRMWLLLSRVGRTTTDFASYEGFQEYWNRRLAELRGDSVRAWTPLQFEVTDFKAEKSVGKPRIEARYHVTVLVRGRRSAGPIYSARHRTTLVRGPDRMWYLESGKLE